MWGRGPAARMNKIMCRAMTRRVSSEGLKRQFLSFPQQPPKPRRRGGAEESESVVVVAEVLELVVVAAAGIV